MGWPKDIVEVFLAQWIGVESGVTQLCPTPARLLLTKFNKVDALEERQDSRVMHKLEALSDDDVMSAEIAAERRWGRANRSIDHQMYKWRVKQVVLRNTLTPK